jgi:DNA modification methylase
MKLYSENENYKLYQGNMLDMLEVIEPESIDSIVCDPPYELNFMGKGWDNSGIAFQPDTWKKCYEVLKPGGYLLAFGGSRTFHRIACAIEDAGFEIRDTIMWLYGSGFPKSMDISKQIDKRADNNNEVIKAKEELGKWLKEKRGNRPQKEIAKYFPSKTGGLTGCVANWELGKNLPTWEIWVKLKKLLDLDDRYDYLIEDRPSNYIEAEREVIGIKKGVGCFNNDEHYTVGGTKANDIDITAPSTDLAKQWNGWGTALKPSFEPIIVARKPFKGSLVDNVIEYGVGGINIDDCRVAFVGNENTLRPLGKSCYQKGNKIVNGGEITGNHELYSEIGGNADKGRFPANTILTYDEKDFDTESWLRYFYCAKASKKDRDEGCQDLEDTVNACSNQAIAELKRGNDTFSDKTNSTFNKVYKGKNTHPTVKPTDLMQYLVRLVSPNGATILDPFNGSGSTGKAVMYENKERNKKYKYIGIELTEEYLHISKARIEYVCNLKEKKDNQTNIFDFIGSDKE